MGEELGSRCESIGNAYSTFTPYQGSGRHRVSARGGDTALALWDMLKTAPAHPPPLPDFPPQGQRSASYRWGLEGRGLSTLAPPPLGEGVVHLFPRVPLEAWAQAPTGARCTEPTQRWAFPPPPPRSASWDHLQMSRFRGSQRQRQAEVPCPRPPCSAVFRRVLAQPVFL